MIKIKTFCAASLYGCAIPFQLTALLLLKIGRGFMDLGEAVKVSI